MNILLSWMICGLVGTLIVNHYDTKHMNLWIKEKDTYFSINPMWEDILVGLLSGYVLLLYGIYVIYEEWFK